MSKKHGTYIIDTDSFTEVIEPIDIGKYAEECQKIYGANKNLYRYFPSLISGLKPVELRLLYTLFIEGRYKGKTIKLSRAGGDTMAFHPHGDTSICDVGIAMSTWWNNNIPITFIDGNNGDVRGKPASAPRYLNISISRFAYDCYFSEFKGANVDMKLSYTGEDWEPEWLPAKYPVALVNGGFSSIGYGFASNVALFNFTELCEATIKLIKDPTSKLYLYPDLPTGADVIMTKKEAKELFEKAENDVKIRMKATANIDYINNVITFTSVPMQVTTGMIVDNLTKFRLQGKFSEIKDVQDRTTDREGIMLQVILNSNANPEEVLEKLYKSKTGLKKSNASSIILIDDYVSDEYSIKSFLLRWIEYRRDAMRSIKNNKLATLLEEQHLNNIKIFIFSDDNVRKTLDLSKSSSSTEEYIRKLIKTYGITSLQAQTIADMKTSAFTRNSHKGYKERAIELEKEIEETKKILEKEKGIDKEIIRELEEGIERWGTPRKSKVVNDEAKLDNYPVIIGISEDGYIKKIKKDGSPIGSVSKNGSVMMMALNAVDTDTLLLFDSSGGKHLLPISQLPMLKEKTVGLSISKYITMDKHAKIITSTIAPRSTEEEMFYILITKKGYAKKISVKNLLKEDVSNGFISGSNAINLVDGDELSTVLISGVNQLDRDIILFTNIGDGMRIPIQDIPTQLSNSRGNKIVSLRTNEDIIGANIILPTDDYLVFVTTNGKVKKTKLSLFPTMTKKDEPLCLVNLDSGEYLVSVKSVNEKEKLIFYKKKNTPEELKVSEIPLKTRAAKAEKMLKTLKGDQIIAMLIVK